MKKLYVILIFLLILMLPLLFACGEDNVVDVTQTGAIKVVADADGFDLMPVNGK